MAHKFSVLLTLALLTACSAAADKTQSEYFKDFQTQVVGLSQRIEVLEARMKRDSSIKGDVYERVDKIEDKLAKMENALNKVKTHPLFEGLDTVKLSAVPSSTVISIRPDNVARVSEQPDKPEAKKDEPSVAREPEVQKQTAVPLQVREDVKPKETPASREEAKVLSAKEKVAALYNRGYDMYNSGKFPQAISIFREFLQAHSSDALADNAQYWIAESYYAQKLFEKAIVEFKKVEQYQDKNKAPDAYYKIMLAYLELGRKQDAAKWRKSLLEKFRDSEAAKMAQEKLSQ